MKTIKKRLTVIFLDDENIVVKGRVYQPHPTMIYGDVRNLKSIKYAPTGFRSNLPPFPVGYCY